MEDDAVCSHPIAGHAVCETHAWSPRPGQRSASSGRSDRPKASTSHHTWNTKSWLVVIARGPHPFPSRTRPLSLAARMVLQGRPCGRVRRRQPLPREGILRAHRSVGSPFFVRGGLPPPRVSPSHTPPTRGRLRSGSSRRSPPSPTAPRTPSHTPRAAVAIAWPTADLSE